MRHVWGWVLSGGLILGGASAAQAQLSVVIGSPYSGVGAMMVNRPSVGYGYGGYGYGGYGTPGYVNTGYANPGYMNSGYINPGYGNSSYSSGYAGYTPYAQQTTGYYNQGYYAPSGGLTTTTYAPIVAQPVYSTGYYQSPRVLYPIRPTYVVRPAPFRQFGRPGFYR